MGILRPLSSVQFLPDNDVKCLSSAIETGNPATGPSTLILKAPSGCVVPWHSHTAQEQLLMISGAILAEMTGLPATTLGPGGFAAMAGGMAHQFTCQDTACLMFVTFDGAYDIFWGKGGRN
jgi:anti-sigma factor ChrR (cupin superfamily)